MLIDSASAKALAAIVVLSTQGIDSLTHQQPLQIVDRGDSWLVKGTPYTDLRIQSKNIASYVFIKKTSAEIIGIGSDARMILSEDEKKELLKVLNPADYDRTFGPRTHFEPGGNLFAINMDMHMALYGGLINSPNDAVAYARVLMQLSPRLAPLPADTLRAEERNLVWHITTIGPKQPDRVEVMSFSRKNGKVLSGDL